MSCIILIFCWNSTKLIVIFKHYSFKWFSLVCILIFIYHQIHFYQLVMGILFGANLFKLDLSASNLILVSFFSRYFTTHFQSTNKRGDLYLVLCFLEIWQFNIRVILIAPVRLENGYGIKSIKTRNTWQYTINRDVLSKCCVVNGPHIIWTLLECWLMSSRKSPEKNAINYNPRMVQGND